MVADVSEEHNTIIFKSQEVHESQKTKTLNEIAMRTSSITSNNASLWIKLLYVPDKSKPKGFWRLGRQKMDFLIVVKSLYSLQYQQRRICLLCCVASCVSTVLTVRPVQIGHLQMIN